MSKIISFSIERAQLVSDSSDSQFATIGIDCCRSGWNFNNYNITKSAIIDSAESIKGKPVLVSVNSQGNDFQGHEVDEIPCGFFVEESPNVYEGKDGELYLYAVAKIWKNYFDDVMSIFQSKNGRTDVSMEIELVDGYFSENTIDLFTFLGVTLLGVEPAISGAQATVLSFSDMKQMYKNSTLKDYSKQRRRELFGKKLSVNKTELKDTPWGDVDKTKLRESVMNASNSGEIVHYVYALVEDGWQDAPSEHLKYPLMQLEGDTLYYNRYALSSALAYAKQEHEDSVVSKIEKLYDKFKIKEKEESDSMSKQFQDEQFDISALMQKHFGDDVDFEIDNFSDEGVITYTKDGKCFTVNANVVKDSEGKIEKCEIDWESDTEVNQESEDDHEDKNAEPEDKEGEDDDIVMEDFSLDANAYAGAMLAMLNAETDEQRAEACKNVFAEGQEEFNTMTDTFCKAFAELHELRKFKADTEEAKKQAEVNKVMADVKCDISEEDFDRLYNEGMKCSYSEMQEFSTKVKAFAYVNSKKKNDKQGNVEDKDVFMGFANKKKEKNDANVFEKYL